MTLLVDPDVVALGGGLSNARRLYRELPAAIGAHLFAGLEPPSIAAPRFGACSGVRGAAILALKGIDSAFVECVGRQTAADRVKI